MQARHWAVAAADDRWHVRCSSDAGARHATHPHHAVDTDVDPWLDTPASPNEGVEGSHGPGVQPLARRRHTREPDPNRAQGGDHACPDSRPRTASPRTSTSLVELVREFVDEQILPVATTSFEHKDEYPTQIVEVRDEKSSA